MQGEDRAEKEDEEIAKQLRAGGCPEAEIAKLLGVQEGGALEYEIWPENADALRAFLFCETQWNAVGVGMGGIVWLGLKYEEVERCWRIEPVQHTTVADAWWALRVLEAEGTRLKNLQVKEAMENH